MAGKRESDMSEVGLRRAVGPRRVFGVMAATTLLTFATLTASYQAFFTHSVFA